MDEQYEKRVQSVVDKMLLTAPDGDWPLIKLPKDVVEYMKQQEPRGYNVYTCKVCGSERITKDIHTGVTPMFMPCTQDNGDCTGIAVSGMYSTPISKEAGWEWYRPNTLEFGNLQRAGHHRDHVMRGGLLIREVKHD